MPHGIISFMKFVLSNLGRSENIYEYLTISLLTFIQDYGILYISNEREAISMDVKVTGFRRCYKFLYAIYHADGFKMKRECDSVLAMMKRYHQKHGAIGELMAIELGDYIERGKKLLTHPERAGSEPKLCAILEDMERAFARN